MTGAAGLARDTLDYRRRLDRADARRDRLDARRIGRRPTRDVAVVNPTLFFAQALKDALIARGIAVSGDAVDLDDVAAELQAAPGAERRVLVVDRSRRRCARSRRC